MELTGGGEVDQQLALVRLRVCGSGGPLDPELDPPDDHAVVDGDVSVLVEGVGGRHAVSVGLELAAVAVDLVPDSSVLIENIIVLQVSLIYLSTMEIDIWYRNIVLLLHL